MVQAEKQQQLVLPSNNDDSINVGVDDDTDLVEEDHQTLNNQVNQYFQHIKQYASSTHEDEEETDDDEMDEDDEDDEDDDDERFVSHNVGVGVGDVDFGVDLDINIDRALSESLANYNADQNRANVNNENRNDITSQISKENDSQAELHRKVLESQQPVITNKQVRVPANSIQNSSVANCDIIRSGHIAQQMPQPLLQQIPRQIVQQVQQQIPPQVQPRVPHIQQQNLKHRQQQLQQQQQHLQQIQLQQQSQQLQQQHLQQKFQQLQQHQPQTQLQHPAQSLPLSISNSRDNIKGDVGLDHSKRECRFCGKTFQHAGSLGRHLDNQKGNDLHPIEEVEKLRSNVARRGDPEAIKARRLQRSKEYNRREYVKEKNRLRRKYTSKLSRVKETYQMRFYRRINHPTLPTHPSFPRMVLFFLPPNAWPHDPPTAQTFKTLVMWLESNQDVQLKIPHLTKSSTVQNHLEKLTIGFENWQTLSTEDRKDMWIREQRAVFQQLLGDLSIFDFAIRDNWAKHLMEEKKVEIGTQKENYNDVIMSGSNTSRTDINSDQGPPGHGNHNHHRNPYSQNETDESNPSDVDVDVEHEHEHHSHHHRLQHHHHSHHTHHPLVNMDPLHMANMDLENMSGLGDQEEEDDEELDEADDVKLEEADLAAVAAAAAAAAAKEEDEDFS